MSQVPREDMKSPRQPIRIISDGTASNTKVFFVNEDDGSDHQIPLVSSVSWSIAAGEPYARATISVVNVEVDVVGETEND